MTAPANRLTGRAMNKAPIPAPLETVTVGELRVLLNAFEGLGYNIGVLLKAAGLERSDFDDPDARLPCTAYGSLVGCAQRARFTPNLPLRLAMLIPIGAFPLLDY